MNCTDCGRAEMEERRENHRYLESGLANVVLRDVLVRRCPRCGHTLVSIAQLSRLHRAPALTLIESRNRLGPQEIRFLRKSLGWSGADFARKFHVRSEQVSRWESDRSHVHMSISNELLLRLLVADGQQVESYADSLEQVATAERQRDRRIEFELQGQDWVAA